MISRNALFVGMMLLLFGFLTACTARATPTPPVITTLPNQSAQTVSSTPSPTLVPTEASTATPTASSSPTSSPTATSPASPTPSPTATKTPKPTATATKEAVTLPIPTYGSWMGDIVASDGTKGAMMIGNLPGKSGIILFLVVEVPDGYAVVLGQRGLRFVADGKGGLSAELLHTKLEDVKVDNSHIEGTFTHDNWEEIKFNLRTPGTATREGFIESAKLVWAVGKGLVQGGESVRDKEGILSAVTISDKTILDLFAEFQITTVAVE